MQTSFASILLAAAALVPTAMSTPTNTIQARVALPKNNQAFLCNMQKNSPGIANIREGLNKLQKVTKGCAPGAHGEAVRMVKDDGISLYIGSTGGQQIGNFDCKNLVEPFQNLMDFCSGNINGDYRAGGTAWVPNYVGQTYVYVTDESY